MVKAKGRQPNNLLSARILITSLGMTKKPGRIILITTMIILVSCVTIIWYYTSPFVEKYQLIYNIEDGNDLSIAFAVALQNNDHAAYKMVDPATHSRLDGWMATHKPVRCAQKAYVILTALSNTNPDKYHPLFGCVITKGLKQFDYNIQIEYVTIQNMSILGWSDPREEIQ
jgi:hypothetical protein